VVVAVFVFRLCWCACGSIICFSLRPLLVPFWPVNIGNFRDFRRGVVVRRKTAHDPPPPPPTPKPL